MKWVRVTKFDTECDVCKTVQHAGFFGNPVNDAEIVRMEKTLGIPVMFICDSCAETRLREDRARRALARDGYTLRKDRARSYSMDNQGGYMIVEANTNRVAAGERYNLDLGDVEHFIEG